MEYLTFKSLKGNEDAGGHRILFLVAHNDRSAVSNLWVIPDYDSWHADVLEQGVPYLPEVDVPEGRMTRYKEIKKIVTEDIRSRIDAAWNQIVEGVPKP